jgi:hypothetical protein
MPCNASFFNFQLQIGAHDFTLKEVFMASEPAVLNNRPSRLLGTGRSIRRQFRGQRTNGSLSAECSQLRHTDITDVLFQGMNDPLLETQHSSRMRSVLLFLIAECKPGLGMSKEVVMSCTLCGHALSHLTALLAQTEIGTQCPKCWATLRCVPRNHAFPGKR